MTPTSTPTPPTNILDNIPDPAFRALLRRQFARRRWPLGRKTITPEAAAQITELKPIGAAIASLAGLEHFPSLRRLECGGNNLTSLDLSHNPLLEYLNCSYNRLSLLDVTRNPALEELSCDRNFLASLDLSHNPALKRLDCRFNRLVSLDISHNPAPGQLSCDESVAVTGCPEAARDKKMAQK